MWMYPNSTYMLLYIVKIKYFKLPVMIQPTSNNNSLDPNNNPKCLSSVFITSTHIFYILNHISIHIHCGTVGVSQTHSVLAWRPHQPKHTHNSPRSSDDMKFISLVPSYRTRLNRDGPGCYSATLSN